jgi:RNA polymerase sigma-70 factor (ECF subfamily)
MMQASDAALLAGGDLDAPAARSTDAHRLSAMASDHYQFIWRSLRRLGVAEQAVDDAAQQVFVLAAAKLDSIAPGSERAFLFQTALRVAMSLRRDFARRREAMVGDVLEEIPDPGLLPDAAAEVQQRRAILDRLLDTLPMELRAVFILFEIEGLGSPEIAALLSIPVGTVASRLRRAREAFHAEAERVRRRMESKVRR